MGLSSSRMPNGTNWAHIEYAKDPEKVLLPSGDLGFIAFRVDEPGERIPLALLDDLLLHLGHGSAIKTHVS
jgi:hypothetical protein